MYDPLDSPDPQNKSYRRHLFFFTLYCFACENIHFEISFTILSNFIHKISCLKMDLQLNYFKINHESQMATVSVNKTKEICKK